VSSVDVVQSLIEEAGTRRSTGSTAANADSSRSHSIMQFALKRFIADGQHSRLVGKISFIDLAGAVLAGGATGWEGWVCLVWA
jgi:kinesin family protein 2/24